MHCYESMMEQCINDSNYARFTSFVQWWWRETSDGVQHADLFRLFLLGWTVAWPITQTFVLLYNSKWNIVDGIERNWCWWRWRGGYRKTKTEKYIFRQTFSSFFFKVLAAVYIYIHLYRERDGVLVDKILLLLSISFLYILPQRLHFPLSPLFLSLSAVSGNCAISRRRRHTFKQEKSKSQRRPSWMILPGRRAHASTGTANPAFRIDKVPSLRSPRSF